MLNPEHSCAVFALAGDLIVLAESLSVDGAWIFNGFAERIAAAAADEDLGAAVLRGLATSTTGVAHPSDWSTFNREAEVQLQRVGVCSFAQLHRQARCVRVDRVGGSVKVTPHASGGASGPGRGFHELEALTEVVEPKSEARVGAMVRAALELCR